MHPDEDGRGRERNKVIQYTSENNKVIVAGKVNSPLIFGHEIYGEGFYNFTLAVPRLSEYVDILPVTISERLLDTTGLSVGTEIVIKGQLRSYNKYIEGKNRLVLTIFTRDISTKNEEIKNPNQIFLDGYICKPPIYRTTPFQREIADILLAVNRAYNKSDYIPVITWGRNARFSQKLSVGQRIRIWGRIQSRLYKKKMPNGEVIDRTAYEVSVSKMEVTDE
ncbi:MAG: single-stranded DNA-binding protein [Clostridiales bacterium]|nr:single-stranded DNA-binding protein [Clostridiales bacterium]